MPKGQALPKPTDYMDYHVFLADWFTAKDGRPSMGTFAKRVPCSKALVSMVAGGQRDLKPRWVEAFIRVLELDDEQAEHFRLLVVAQGSGTRAERTMAWEQLRSARGFQEAHPITGALYRLLSEPHLAVVRELRHCEGYQNDPAWIARMVRPQITHEEAKQALEELQEIETNTVKQVSEAVEGSQTLATSHQGHDWLRQTALLRYHSNALELAKEALDAFSSEERMMGAFTVGVPASLLPELRRRVERFQEEIIHLCSEAEASSDIVYQLGVQLFPVSGTTSDPG